jgi:hypothetical protein
MTSATPQPRAVRLAEAVVLQQAAGLSDVIEPDYAYGCAVRPRQPCDWSAEEWARQVFEAAPRPVRTLIVLGWRFGLRLRLGPTRDAAHVLGWRIVGRASSDVVLAVGSPLLEARLVIQVRDKMACHLTFIRFERRLTRVLWAVAAPIHERVIPYLLSDAAAGCGLEE